MEIGIVGLPNVGKSSLFNAMTAAGVPSENFPFTTIEPNVGVVAVGDDRLNFLADHFKSVKKIPAAIRFVDIAGLVPGASKGEGRGNEFLSHIRDVDAIAQVVRCFRDDDIVSVMGDINPRRDGEAITMELLLADLDRADKFKKKVEGAARTGQADAKKRLDALNQIIDALGAGKPVRKVSVDPAFLREWNFLTAKPILFVANVNEDVNPAHLDEVKAYAEENQATWIPINVKVEAEVMSLPEEERNDFRKELGITESGLGLLARSGQRLLDLITFFTAGEKESRAWQVRNGSPIPVAAGKIHSDMEKGFIRAEVYSVDDLKTAKSEANLKAAGKIRMEGKDYITKDGDVVVIHFN